MAKAAAAYKLVIEEQRRRLARVTQGKSLAQMKAIYDKAERELLARIKAQVGKNTPFTGYHYNLMLAQIRSGQLQMAAKFTAGLRTTSLEAQEVALEGVVSDVGRMSRVFSRHAPVLRVHEAAVQAGVIDNLRPSILSMHKRSMATYGSRLVKQMQNQLAIGQISGASTDDVIKQIADTAKVEWWQASRIARTENAYAFGATASDTIAEIDKQLDGTLYQRWSEHVSDAGIPLDDRVGFDSIAMNGQLAKPGNLFTMPNDDARVPKSLVGLSFEHTPCRPNGRECLTPWAKGWGGYAYLWQGGKRVVLSR